jgi:hypothetical protein
MSIPSSSIDNQYLDKLRSWYLARLRKLALTEEVSRQATPQALIGADKLIIQEQIESSLPLELDAQEERLINQRYALIVGSGIVVSVLVAVIIFSL